jgi:hypothetical protein
MRSWLHIVHPLSLPTFDGFNVSGSKGAEAAHDHGPNAIGVFRGLNCLEKNWLYGRASPKTGNPTSPKPQTSLNSTIKCSSREESRKDTDSVIMRYRP